MTSSTFQILVPTDFTAQSLAAFSQSCRIAELYNASITLLHIVEDLEDAYKNFEVSDPDLLLQKIDDKLNLIVKEELAISKKIVSCKIEFGAIVDQIIETQKKQACNMIVMGFNALHNQPNMQIGSTAMEVIKRAPCQVVTVKNKSYSGEFKSIILPIDLSKSVTQIIAKTIELAKSWKGAVVNLISVLPVCDEHRVNTATHQLAGIVKEIELNNIVCNAEIIRMIKGHESVAEIVADYAQRVKSEMIMLITRHEIGSSANIGNSTQSILNSIEIPMFSIVPLVNQN
ncbi:MAG TPA: universal stress protein [Bacteroidia bacterium]|nr:universal stress protein [Bacteroidia bacterium]HRH09383.1 universal stress protein [Bacteroidia bacterium]HRH64502.1 universal stress protein [Bacteroidia bacterium]